MVSCLNSQHIHSQAFNYKGTELCLPQMLQHHEAFLPHMQNCISRSSNSHTSYKKIEACTISDSVMLLYLNFAKECEINEIDKKLIT